VSYSTDNVAAPGTRFSLVLYITPAQGVHVYAPGVSGYKPIALNIAAQPGVIVRDGAQQQPYSAQHESFDGSLNLEMATIFSASAMVGNTWSRSMKSWIVARCFMAIAAS